MANSNKKQDTKKEDGNEQPSPAAQHKAEQKAANQAHEQAEHDIAEDPDLSIHSPNDDLDEGETARLGEDEVPLV